MLQLHGSDNSRSQVARMFQTRVEKTYQNRGTFHVVCKRSLLISSSQNAFYRDIAASVALAYFCLDVWSCDLYWWIFGLCSALPALSEGLLLIGTLGHKWQWCC